VIVFGGTSATPILVEDPQAEIPVGGLGLVQHRMPLCRTFFAWLLV
jgi:hypothetical protein